MQKIIRVKDEKDLLALKTLMDDGWYIVDSNVMQFVTTTIPAKTPVTKTYGGYIDYILHSPYSLPDAANTYFAGGDGTLTT